MPPSSPRPAAALAVLFLVAIGPARLGATTAEPPPAPLTRAVEALRAMEGTRSLLVSHRGRLVVEEHFRGDGGPWNVKSVTKSILSALIGIALERGDLESVEQTVGEFFPRWAERPEGEIRLRDLLSMSSGLESTSGKNYGAWVSHSDWVRAALEQRLLAEPGRRFSYSTGDSHILSAILVRATGRSTLEFARRVLFEPVGIDVAAWQTSPQGIHFGGNNLSLTPRDMLRFGQLYLEQGRANGEVVVPREWVASSTRPHAEGWPERYGRYGYLWWVRPEENAFLAVGYGGQFIYVAPDAELVVVLTSSHAAKGEAWDRRVLRIFRDQLVAAVTAAPRSAPSPRSGDGASRVTSPER